MKRKPLMTRLLGNKRIQRGICPSQEDQQPPATVIVEGRLIAIHLPRTAGGGIAIEIPPFYPDVDFIFVQGTGGAYRDIVYSVDGQDFVVCSGQEFEEWLTERLSEQTEPEPPTPPDDGGDQWKF